MATIDIEEIIDYAKCPMLYAFKYKYKHHKTDYVNITEKYNEDIHKVIYYSFSKIQNGSSMRIEDIKVAWGRAWIKDKRKNSLVFSDTPSNKDIYNDKRKKGFESLMSFYKKFNKNPGFPVIINEDYKLNITNSLVLTGKYEVVRELEDELSNKYLEVCIFKTDDCSNYSINNLYDLKLIASSLAICNDVEYNNKKYMIYNVDKKRTFYLKDVNLDKALFKKNILNIYKCIYNEIYYICPNEKCITCIYKDICNDMENISEMLNK